MCERTEVSILIALGFNSVWTDAQLHKANE